MRYADLTWPELREVSRDTVVLAPFGACEQHGPFLPFFTDAILVREVAERVEAELGNEVLLLPTQWLGASQHHLAFGALTADLDTYTPLVRDVCESVLQAGFRRLFVLNGHGGNIDSIRIALRQLDLSYHEARLTCASYWSAAGKEIAAILSGPYKAVGHACEVETSMMLYVHPELVRREKIRDDCEHFTGPAFRGVDVIRSAAEWGEVGAHGYATQASAEKGERLMDAIVARVVEVVQALRHTGANGLPEA